MGPQHAALWVALAGDGRAVEVVIGRDAQRLAAAGQVLDTCAREVGGEDGRDQEGERDGRRGPRGSRSAGV